MTSCPHPIPQFPHVTLLVGLPALYVGCEALGGVRAMVLMG